MASLAQLGVAINSGPAKEGSTEVKRELKGIATEAKATTQAVVTANRAVTASMEEQVKAQLKAEAAARKAAAEKKRQADAERDLANALKRVAEEEQRAAEKIAAAEQQKARAMAAAEEAAYKMDAAMRKQSAAFGLGEQGANRLRSSLAAVTTQITGTSSSATVLTSTIGSLAIGNAATVGVLAGLAAIGLAYDAVTAAANATRKATDEAIRSSDELRKRQRQGATGDLPEQTRTLLQEQARATRDLAAAQKNLNELRAVGSATGAKTGVSGADQQAAALAVQAAKVKDLQNRIATNQREINRVLAASNAEYSKLNDERLITLVRSGNATVAEQTALKNRLKNLQDDLAKLTAGGGDTGARADLSERISAITAVYEAQGKAAEKANRDALKSGRELIDFQARYEASLLDVTTKIAEYDKAQAKLKEKQDELNKAVADGITARARDNAILRERIASVLGEANAFDQLTAAKAEEKAVAEARAKLGKDGFLDPIVEGVIRNQVREWYNLNNVLKDVTKTQKILDEFRQDRKNPFTLPDDAAAAAKRYTDALKNGLADALQIASQIAAAIDSGQGEGRALRGGLGSALGTFGGPGGKVAAAGLQLADALDLFGDRARERAQQLAQLATQFNASLDAFAIGKSTNLQSALKGNAATATSLAQQAAAASGASFSGAFTNAADIEKQIAYLQSYADKNRLVRESLGPFIERLKELAVITKANEEALRAQNAAELATLTDNLQVRRLAAAGLTDLADAERRRLAQLQEVQEAEDKFGKDSPYLQALRDVQAAENAAAEAARAAAEAERERVRVATGYDIDARRNALAGNDRAANGLRAQGTRDSALAEAQALFAAGKITAEMLASLTEVINGEFNKALADFDVQAQRAARTQQEDLAIRILAAQGFTREAEQARVEAANRKELEGITDDNIRSLILYAQGLEAEARKRQEAAELAATWLDINERTANALKLVNPEAARALELQLTQAKRDAELAAAKDDVIRQALRELYALEDQADAMNKAADAAKAVTDAIIAQADAMNALADLSLSIQDDFLRATGRTFDADKNALGRKRDERIGAVVSGVAAAAGPPPILNPNDPTSYIRFAEWQAKFAGLQAQAQDDIGKINATYNANLDKLIRDQMSGTAPSNYSLDGGASSARAGVDAGTVLGGDSVTFRSGNSVTETTGMRLVDYAASSDRHLARLVQLAEGRSGGGDASNLLPSLARQLDRSFGRRANDQRLTIFGEIA